MQRTTDADRLIDANGAGRDGFTEGSPPTVPRTIVGADWLNGIQEEVCRAIEMLGGTLDGGDLEQLGTLLLAMDTTLAGATQGPASSTDNAIVRFNGTTGKLVQNSGIQVTDGAELAYTTPPTRTVILSPAVAHVGDSANSWSRTNASATLKSNDMILTWDLSGRLPTGASITSLEIAVTPGTPRGPANRMVLRLVTVTDAGSATTVDSQTDNGSLDPQTLALTGLPVSVTNGVATYLVELEAGASAGADNDTVGMLVVEYTDPGPRNY